MIPIARPQMGEEEKRSVWAALESGSLAQGARVRQLEEEFAAFVGVPHAVATSSGTTALHLALLAAGVGEGDEVVTVPFTFIASATSVLYTGARPAFVDVRADDFCIDPDQVEAAITPRTRAIMPVSLYGQPADMPALAEIAERRGLALVEDAAQAHGAAIGERRSGSWGVGCFSFYPTKNMHSLEGGMITTGDATLARNLRLLRNQGMEARYANEIVGANMRLTDVAAAIGRVQLGKLEDWTAQRRQNAATLSAGLKGVVPPPEADGARHVYHQYTIRVPDEVGRDRMLAGLKERGVGSAVYYPTPIHLLKPYLPGFTDLAGQQPPNRGWDLPETMKAAEEVLSLPVYPGLTEDDLGRIVDAVNDLAAGA
jgi:dTDP-4-amino-4,6-dideoxygalactose transaminase